MGIRIYKKLGWGIKDLADKDPRINLDAFRGENSKIYNTEIEDYFVWLTDIYEEDKEKEFSDRDLELHLEWQEIKHTLERNKRIRELREEHDLSPGQLPTKGLPSMYETVTYNYEYGLNVLHVIPVHEVNLWRRYADPIDYAEHDVKYWNDPDYMVSTAHILPDAPFPYNSFWIDKRTGERIKGNYQTSIHAWMRLRNSKPEEAITDEITLSLIGMTTQEALENIIPCIPTSVQRVVDFTEVFTDDDTWLQLRPMLYTHWG